ncbi:PAS domain-containing protein [Maribellus comscasis]|uniref:PAS domain-containing protein n=1 Tax=Maribellus comscasis TaxID=2681766 RepID=A0A6I6K2J8_9BACT|nr:chemotaxis protein CheB [Maribellus comscasis]QGY47678.1 PAS domain-containing protein [Maribellus comscasis]
MSNKKNLWVVGIGASAGGLDAIQQLFDKLPNDTGSAFIIIQHLSPDFKSLMPELLAKHTKMKIFTAEDKQTIAANCIYFNQRGKNLQIKGNKLYLFDKEPKKNLNLPIDIFFHSLGEEYREKSIGVILSGTGSDGSRGIKTIKERGGTVIVQEPESAQFNGMPNSAIETNLVDHILPPGEIAHILIRFPGQYLALSEKETKSNDVVFYRIINEVYKNSGIDFKQYKKNTLLRRLKKRMSINNFEQCTDYYAFLKSNSKEKDILRQDFLIGVTSFFRDIEAFEVLKTKIIPELIKQKKNTDTIRIWIPGCSTGEEAYSIAILFDDYIRTHKLNNDFKIFATDIDSQALNNAGHGQYHFKNELDDFYLENYFVKSGEEIEIIKRIRDRIVFSNHNILKDPPFIRMDFISCRNLLIYLENNIQYKIILNFQFALNTGGYLFLGNSESLGKASVFFKVIDSKWKIFQNITDAKQIPGQSNPEERISSLTYKSQRDKVIQHEYRYKENPESAFHRYLSKKYSPAVIFINREFDILYIQGDAGKKLSYNEGIFQNNLLKAVSPEIATSLRSGMRRLMLENKDIFIKDVQSNSEKKKFTFDIGLHKAEELANYNDVYFVSFGRDKETSKNETIEIDSVPLDIASKQRLEDAENELKATKSELQNVVEELETSNEELQSSNEELMASNEELQSTNEELQSVNEELYTVNAELQEKNKELQTLNDDVNNLLDSTEIGTLFLDTELRIRKFTAPLKKHFKLRNSDIGRPIAGFASNFRDNIINDVLGDSKTSLEKLTTIEKEIVDLDGKNYLMRVGPYITIQKKIEGVVITFVDINELKKKEAALQAKTDELIKAEEIAKMGSWVLNIQTNEVFWTKELYKMYGFDPSLPPPPYSEHGKLFTPESWKILSKSLDKAIKEGIAYELELQTIKKNGSNGWMWITGDVSRDQNGKITHLRGVAQDITIRRNLHEELMREQKFSKKITELSPSAKYIYNFKKGTNTYMNPQFERILGYSSEEIKTMTENEFMSLYHPDDKEKIQKHMSEIAEGLEFCKIEYRFRNKKGDWVWCYSINSPFEKDVDGKIISFIGVFMDITEKKKNEEILKQAIIKANSANIYKDQFLANMSHEIRTPMNGLLGFAGLLREDGIDDKTKNEYVDIIEKNSKQLLNLIDDIIDVSKIEAGELKLNKEVCYLQKIFTDTEATFNEIKKQKQKEHITIKAIIPEKYSKLAIETDPLRLQQVLTNLVSNALKFSRKGTIKFGYTIKNDRVEIFVKDQGIGIPKDKLDTVFERFERIENINHKSDGTGLGLSISRGIVRLLEGKMSVKSTHGKGSIFRFEIPYKRVEDQSENIEKEALVNENSLQNKTILIAEDEESNIHYLSVLFKDKAVKLFWAKNGKEAVEMVKSHPDINIILMDIRMPVMNGDIAAEKILKLNKDIKIIAQTAFTMSGDKEKYLQKGFVDYIPKPIRKNELLEKISKWAID